jgi:hypothetical protein
MLEEPLQSQVATLARLAAPARSRSTAANHHVHHGGAPEVRAEAATAAHAPIAVATAAATVELAKRQVDIFICCDINPTTWNTTIAHLSVGDASCFFGVGSITASIRFSWLIMLATLAKCAITLAVIVSRTLASEQRCNVPGVGSNNTGTHVDSNSRQT